MKTRGESVPNEGRGNDYVKEVVRNGEKARICQPESRVVRVVGLFDRDAPFSDGIIVSPPQVLNRDVGAP